MFQYLIFRLMLLGPLYKRHGAAKGVYPVSVNFDNRMIACHSTPRRCDLMVGDLLLKPAWVGQNEQLCDTETRGTEQQSSCGTDNAAGENLSVA